MPKSKTKKPWNRDQFVKNELRKAFKRSPQYHAALAAAKEEYYIPSKHGKHLRRVRMVCAKCNRSFVKKEGESNPIAVDHIIPIERVDEISIDMNTYIDRLFCDIDNLMVLCNYAKERDGVKSCHKIKTSIEATQRSQFRKSQTKRKKK